MPNYIIFPRPAPRLWDGVKRPGFFRVKDHVSKVVQSAWVGVRKVGHLRKFLNPLSSEKLVHAFITSHLDYCNSLLSGLPDKDISRLQRIQNASARIIKCAKRSDSISRLLQDLHWLPVHLRGKSSKYFSPCTNALTVLLLTIFVSSSRHTHQHVDSDPYHKAWLFNPKLHQKLIWWKGVSLSWVLSLWNSLPTWIRTLPSIPSF